MQRYSHPHDLEHPCFYVVSHHVGELSDHFTHRHLQLDNTELPVEEATRYGVLTGGRSHDVIDAYPLLDRGAPTAGTVGSLDMGGGSLQVTFQVDPDVSGLPSSG